MKRAITIISAAALTVTAMGAAIAPASAAPTHNFNQQQQHRSYSKPVQKQQPRFERHGDYAYLNGHKGFKQRHAGYRYYDGYWFPVAAFVGFAIIGGILSQLIH